MTKQSIFKIFVSHSHKDNQFGIQLVYDLRHKLGNNAKIWYDAADGLDSGDEWWTKILKELVASSVFIVVLTPEAMASKWVNDEITIAWAHKNSQEGKLIIPILYRECKIRDDLRTLHIVSFLDSKPYDVALDELIKRLEKFRSKNPNTSAMSKPSCSPSWRSSDTPQLAPRPSPKLTRHLLRQNILMDKTTGRYNSEVRKVHESLRSLHQSTALRTSRLEKAQMNEMEILSLNLPPSGKLSNRPIILDHNSQKKK